jgi:hypothetical protein
VSVERVLRQFARTRSALLLAPRRAGNSSRLKS